MRVKEVVWSGLFLGKVEREKGWVGWEVLGLHAGLYTYSDIVYEYNININKIINMSEQMEENVRMGE